MSVTRQNGRPLASGGPFFHVARVSTTLPFDPGFRANESSSCTGWVLFSNFSTVDHGRLRKISKTATAHTGFRRAQFYLKNHDRRGFKFALVAIVYKILRLF